MKRKTVLQMAALLLIAIVMMVSFTACYGDRDKIEPSDSYMIDTTPPWGGPTNSFCVVPPTATPTPTYSSISDAKVGDTVNFGEYEQDNNRSNGKEKIDWIILAEEDNMVLVTSRYVLDTKQYHTTEASVTWKTSSLRAWLNGAFFNVAFSSDEQSQIATTVVETKYNSDNVLSDNYVDTTNDKVFLLSIGEVYKYFASSEERSIYGTAYARSMGLSTIPDEYLTDETQRNKCDWWLRDYHSNGYNVGCCLSYINNGGDIGTYAATVEGLGVRPAMWIATEKLAGDEPVKTPKVETIYTISNIGDANVGDTVKFGHYEQDSESSNSKEDIEWTVLDKKDNKLFVVSKYVLDAEPYNIARENVTWETCTIRTWLNYIFLNAAFSSDEQSKIATTLLENRDTSHYAESPYVGSNTNSDILATYAPVHYMTDGGNDTNDKIFLLSASELYKYLGSEYAKKTYGTKYTSEKIGSEHCSYWWTRSPGKSNSHALYVSNNGFLHPDGDYVDSKDCGIRPAMWINIE